MHNQKIITDFLIYKCNFNMILSNYNCNIIDTGNGKNFFIYKDGRIKYGYDEYNSKDYTTYYSVKKMKEILKRDNYEIL